MNISPYSQLAVSRATRLRPLRVTVTASALLFGHDLGVQQVIWAPGARVRKLYQVQPRFLRGHPARLCMRAGNERRQLGVQAGAVIQNGLRLDLGVQHAVQPTLRAPRGLDLPLQEVG